MKPDKNLKERERGLEKRKKKEEVPLRYLVPNALTTARYA